MRSRGWLYATRIPKKGARDCGDMILDQAVPVMVESKEVKTFTPSTIVNEVAVQIENAKAEFGFAIVKRRGTTDVGKYYALTSVETMMSLIERVYRPSPAQVAGVEVWQCGAYDAYGQCTVYAGHLNEGIPHRDDHEPRAFQETGTPQRKTKTFTRR